MGSEERPRRPALPARQARGRGKPPRKGTSATSTTRSQRPQGREAVMTAILDAATTLFAARGPASVTVRDIAAAAAVNHALLHRHFGTKHDVLRAVLEQTVQEIAGIATEMTDVRAGIEQLFAASAAHETYWRALARALLDGENPRTLQRDFPTVRRLITMLQSERRPRRRPVDHAPSTRAHDVRIVVGALSALMLGWLVFEPFLLVATGLDKEDREKVREQVIHLLQTMVALTS